MSEIDERLAEIRERTNRYIFHEATDDALRQAEDDLHYLLDLVEQLRQVRGNWSPDYKRQVLYELEAAEAEAAALRERLAEAQASAAESRTLLVKGYGVMERADGVLDNADERVRELEQQLAAAEAGAALVPDRALVIRAAEYADSAAYATPDDAASNTASTDATQLYYLAARIRAWRGDGEEGEEGSDGD